MSDPVYRVMLSSTFEDLKGHRKAVIEAMHRHDMLQLAMETDSAVATRGIVENSLAKVEQAEI